MTDDTTLDLPDQLEMNEALDKPISLSDLPEATPLNPADIPPELISAIKAQVVAEMQNDDKRKEEEAKIRREAAKKEHDEYVSKMKASPDPWVEIEGWVETEKGVKVELEWNEPFVKFLREQGITGADEDQVVQKWIALLMKDLTSQMGEETQSDGDYS